MRNAYSSTTPALILVALAALVAGCDEAPTPPESAGFESPSFASVSPELVDGNPTCDDLFDDPVREFKIDELPSVGTYDDPDGPLTVNITDVTGGGTTVSWTSDPSVDGVIVKGGPNANFYEYDPESNGDTDLETPVDGGPQPEISHVSFCYDVEDARISLEASGANEVGQAHTFTATVEQSIEGGPWTAVEGTTVSFSLTAVSGSGASFVGGNTCTTDAAGQCAVEINSPTAGTFEVTASATVEVDNASTAEVQAESDPETKVYADASIAIGPENATNTLGETHVFTVTVTADDGDGDAPHPVQGVNPSVAITPPGFDLIEDTCASAGTDASGQCTVTINSDTEETYTANASVTVDVVTSQGTVTGITRATDGASGPDGTGPATKTYESNGGDGGEGCTLTQGYWKTHDGLGRGPQENAWDDGIDPDDPFFDGPGERFEGEGYTWSSILDAPPRGEEAIVLAHQYVAARLNEANGASVPTDVADILSNAQDYLEGDGPDRETVIGWSETLANYNEGLIGPGHCDDDDSSEE